MCKMAFKEPFKSVYSSTASGFHKASYEDGHGEKTPLYKQMFCLNAILFEKGKKIVHDALTLNGLKKRNA